MGEEWRGRAGGRRTRQRALGGQRNRQRRHEQLVRHGVDDRPDDGPPVPLPRDPPVEQVRDARVREQAQGPRVLVLEDEVADNGRGGDAREGEHVGEVVKVLVERRGLRRGRGGRRGLRRGPRRALLDGLDPLPPWGVPGSSLPRGGIPLLLPNRRHDREGRPRLGAKHAARTDAGPTSDQSRPGGRGWPSTAQAPQGRPPQKERHGEMRAFRWSAEVWREREGGRRGGRGAGLLRGRRLSRYGVCGPFFRGASVRPP